MYKSARDFPAPIQKYPDVGRRFQRVHLDLIGPLPVSNGGYRYIMSVVDAFTRYAIAAPISSKEAREVARCWVTHVIAKHGSPEQVVSDNGSEFLNQIFQEVNKMLRVKHTTTTPYHPAANGLVERFNGSVVKILKTLASENIYNWDVMLPIAVFAYNTAYNRTVKDSPQFLMYLRDARVPYDVLEGNKTIWYNVDDYKAELSCTLQRVFQTVQLNLDEAFASYNRHRKSRVKQIQLGDRVYVKNSRKDIQGKLRPVYEGHIE